MLRLKIINNHIKEDIYIHTHTYEDEDLDGLKKENSVLA
jgi:hypothetical protein